MANLLEEASILLTPTAYDNGRMLAVKPEIALGEELILNGDFSDGETGWNVAYTNTTLSINDNELRATANSTGAYGMSQGFSLNNGSTYRVVSTINVDNASGGTANLRIATSSNLSAGNITLSQVTGTTTTTFVATSDTMYIGIVDTADNSNNYVEIDNISVKEDLSGDFQFSRNSAATRVNAQGLVENVQILSSNLVSNGDFSQEGVQEVSNGSFSQEGAELITNGDFSSDTDWNIVNNAGTASEIINGYARIKTDGAYTQIDQPSVTIAAKSYKLQYTILESDGGVLGFITNGNQTVSIPTTIGTHIYYFVAHSTSIVFKRFSGALDVKINNVSVKEVGQDWTLGAGWSIGEDKAVFDGAGFNATRTNAGLITGKSYKVTFDLDIISGNVIVQLGGAANTFNTSTTHTFFDIATENGPYSSFVSLYSSQTSNFSITNISVKEVGQNWELEDGWSIGENKATFDRIIGGAGNINQNNTLVAGKNYKLTFDTLETNGGNIAYKFGSGFTFISAIQANTTHTVYGTSAGAQFTLRGADNFIGSVTNISIIEITDDTNLPRINYEGFSYQDSLGSEEIVNGDFSNGSANWNLGTGWSISGGTANCVSDNNNLKQGVGVTANKTYKVTFDVSVYTSGVLYIDIGSSSSQTTASSGSKTFYFTTTSTNDLRFYGGAFRGSIDNVSVKEYLGQEVVPNSACGSWLLEPQSTNLITYSEDFSQWSNISDVTLEGGFPSPDGGNNAYKVTKNGGNAHIAGYSGINTNNHKSIWARTTNGTGQIMLMNSITSQQYSLTDKWQRFNIEHSGGNWFYGVDFRNASVTLTEVLIYGAQLEQKSFSTSYIPTSGATSTRLQDIANNSGNASLINSESGVLYAEISPFDNGAYNIWSLSNLSNKEIWIGAKNGLLASSLYDGTTFVINNSVSLLDGNNKAALKWVSGTSAEVWLNGLKVYTYTGTIPTYVANDLTTFGQGDRQGGFPFYGKTKALAVYKTALTDASLRSLTYPPAVATTFDLNFNTIAEQFTFTRGSEATFVNAQGLIQSTNEIGSELVTNGDFATGSANWFLTGLSFWVNSSIEVPTGGLTQLFTLENNKTYKITFDVIQGSGINGGVYVNTNYNSPVFADNVGVTTTGVGGTYTFIFTMNGSGNGITLTRRVNNQDIRIDNVSVKEYTTATNTPRLDYSTGSEAFLLEPQSTNLITQSETFSDAVWTKSGTTVTSGFLSPDGTTNAYKITENTANSVHKLQIINGVPNSFQNQSIFVKYDNSQQFIQTTSSRSISNYVNFDISNKTFTNFGTSVGNIIELNNGWLRLDVYHDSSTTVYWHFITSLTSVWSESYLGTEKYLLIWGAQVEAQSYATSYIPTSGASATRNQELCNNATPVINSEEGTLYAEISALANGVGGAISLSDGTSNNYIYLYFHPSGTKIVAKIVVNSITVYDKNITSLDEVNYNKIAFKYQDSSFKIFANGVNISSLNQNSGNTFPINILNKLSFDNGAGSLDFFGNTKDLKYYPKALADVQLQDLTTI